VLVMLGCATALAAAGCASSSIQADATAFLGEHGLAAMHAAAATRSVESAVGTLTPSSSRSQLQAISRAAAQARRGDVQAGEWNLATSGEGGEEGLEEEDLPRAETETTEAAGELANAMASLQRYVHARTPSALAAYKTELDRGRERWDESVSQLWHLAHRGSPPTL
jgi:hypothetical protein